MASFKTILSPFSRAGEDNKRISRTPSTKLPPQLPRPVDTQGFEVVRMSAEPFHLFRPPSKKEIEKAEAVAIATRERRERREKERIEKKKRQAVEKLEKEKAKLEKERAKEAIRARKEQESDNRSIFDQSSLGGDWAGSGESLSRGDSVGSRSTPDRDSRDRESVFGLGKKLRKSSVRGAHPPISGPQYVETSLSIGDPGYASVPETQLLGGPPRRLSTQAPVRPERPDRSDVAGRYVHQINPAFTKYVQQQRQYTPVESPQEPQQDSPDVFDDEYHSFMRNGPSMHQSNHFLPSPMEPPTPTMSQTSYDSSLDLAQVQTTDSFIARQAQPLAPQPPRPPPRQSSRQALQRVPESPIEDHAQFVFPDNAAKPIAWAISTDEPVATDTDHTAPRSENAQFENRKSRSTSNASQAGVRFKNPGLVNDGSHQKTGSASSAIRHAQSTPNLYGTTSTVRPSSQGSETLGAEIFFENPTPPRKAYHSLRKGSRRRNSAQLLQAYLGGPVTEGNLDDAVDWLYTHASENGFDLDYEYGYEEDVVAVPESAPPHVGTFAEVSPQYAPEYITSSPPPKRSESRQSVQEMLANLRLDRATKNTQSTYIDQVFKFLDEDLGLSESTTPVRVPPSEQKNQLDAYYMDESNANFLKDEDEDDDWGFNSFRPATSPTTSLTRKTQSRAFTNETPGSPNSLRRANSISTHRPSASVSNVPELSHVTTFDSYASSSSYADQNPSHHSNGTAAASSFRRSVSLRNPATANRTSPGEYTLHSYFPPTTGKKRTDSSLTHSSSQHDSAPALDNEIITPPDSNHSSANSAFFLRHLNAKGVSQPGRFELGMSYPPAMDGIVEGHEEVVAAGGKGHPIVAQPYGDDFNYF